MIPGPAARGNILPFDPSGTRVRSVIEYTPLKVKAARGGGGGGDGQWDAAIKLMEAFALGRRQKVEAAIEGPRPQQQAKDTQKRAQTGAGGQVLAVARLTTTQARSCWARPSSADY